MNQYLLDTTVLIDIERGLADNDYLIEDESYSSIAAITLAELHVGLEFGSRDTIDRRRTFLADVLSLVDVVAYDASVAVEHGVLLAHTRRTGTPRGAHDLMIAATARATGRTIISSDSRAFAELPGVEVISHR